MQQIEQNPMERVETEGGSDVFGMPASFKGRAVELELGTSSTISGGCCSC